MAYEQLKLFVPEINIKSGLEAIILTIRDDFDNAANENQTILYRMLNGLQFGNYDFYNEAKKVIIDDSPDNPRKLEVRSFFDPTRAHMPTIHLTLPGEDSSEATNGIGVDRGSFEVEYNDPNTPTGWIDYLGRRFGAAYDIIVTSDNSNEIVLLYSFLKGSFIAFFDHWSMMGFENLSLSGGDLDSLPDLPARCFMRGFRMTFQYQVRVLEHFEQQIINNFNLIQQVNVNL